jgi:hypothetical protein
MRYQNGVYNGTRKRLVEDHFRFGAIRHTHHKKNGCETYDEIKPAALSQLKQEQAAAILKELF